MTSIPSIRGSWRAGLIAATLCLSLSLAGCNVEELNRVQAEWDAQHHPGTGVAFVGAPKLIGNVIAAYRATPAQQQAARQVAQAYVQRISAQPSKLPSQISREIGGAPKKIRYAGPGSTPPAAAPGQVAGSDEPADGNRELFANFLHNSVLGRFEVADAYAKKLIANQPDPAEIMRCVCTICSTDS